MCGCANTHLSLTRYALPAQAQSALGLSEGHEQVVVEYLRSGRRQRSQCLKTVDSTFEELMESRLNEDTFTCKLL